MGGGKYTDYSHSFAVRRGSKDIWFAAAMGNTEFGKFISSGTIHLDGTDLFSGKMVLARRYIRDEDPRAAFTATKVLRALCAHGELLPINAKEQTKDRQLLKRKRDDKAAETAENEDDAEDSIRKKARFHAELKHLSHLQPVQQYRKTTRGRRPALVVTSEDHANAVASNLESTMNML